ncbi:zinc finger CCCH domain-containing protein 55 [Brachypodium distachyon]|uniref:C3H1-type domain-containing protein n=1 Tax=Brachypodium distachyon TaxID=15368 RepID=I1I0R9_BRADI|nr:zinc finger CCCH domain-containing protein 55 [Brachypodium distachyon]XP_010234285.1 zinc finger CCCH domain-containing protein 55 [Brachypodium distachyon]XP_010234286.1 zinc finger CCCH domain-containing protein 55 [Brachypodium distachyon]KQJ94984.1 hypothetical protein BRADI_3g14480v3 [Brachypodium distachyon]|eukprot:XP_010234284.1 zinc finger CCCH domain-containing protein 55 [Brachypodium distachyon]
MTGVARRGRSKWDTQEISPDIVEISEDESPPMNKDDQSKDGDSLPSQDRTNDNGKQLGESSNLKPDAFMHRGSAGQEQEHTHGLNKDIKERQSKASSERSQPSRMADDVHNNNGWGKLGLEKATGNQGMSRYADDRRRGDGWGTAVGRGYPSRMSSGPDAWRQRSRSPSPRGAWNRSRRIRSRSRSRSRSRERGRGRSRSPYFSDRGSDWRVDRGRASGGPSLLCRDFTAGRCRRGLHCRFPHEDGGRREFDELYAADPRERYVHENKDFMDPREPNDYLRSRPSRGHYEEGTRERSEPRRDYRSADQCNDFVRGRCSRGANCRYAHDDSASHVGWRDDVREIAHGRGGPDSSFGNRTEHRRENKKPCKFFAEGRCRRGQSCPYLHEETPQSQMGLGPPDEPPKYSDARTTGGNYSNWGEQTNATHGSSHILSRDDRENPGSQGTGRVDTGYEYKNRQLKEAGRSQYQIIPQEDFGSQAQNKQEMTASKQPQFLSPIQTSVDSMNHDKVAGTDGPSGSGTTGNLSMQTAMHAANLLQAQNLSQIAQSQDAIPPAPTLPVTSQLQNATSILPFNSQLQQSDFSLHPNRQDQFLASQTAAPYMGHNQHGYTPGPHALPDLSILNGQNFSVAGQVPENRPTPAHAGQRQATMDMPNPSQDSGTQSRQDTHNFQPVAPNMQTQNQTLQGLSGQDSGIQSIHNTHNFLPVSQYVQSQTQNLQGLSVLPNSSSADMVGAPVPRNAATSGEDFRRAVTSLAPFLMQTGTTGLQSSQPNLNPSLMVTSSAATPAVQPNMWPWAQQQAGMVQPTHPIPSEQQAPQTFQVSTAAGTSNGNPVLLTHSVVPTAHAATSVVNETTMPSENKKGEPRDTEGEAPEDGDNKKSKESKALKLFKLALADFVKEALKPTWKEGQMTREVHKTIVKKVVDKVTSTVENTPQTKEKIEVYMAYSKEKLSKLVQAYVGKYVKA